MSKDDFNLLDLIQNVDNFERPRRTLLYGVPGIGKTTFGASSNKPLFLPVEDGMHGIPPSVREGVKSFPISKTFNEFGRNIHLLVKSAQKGEPFPYETIVIDSADELEQLIWTHVCVEAGKDSISSFGYGGGYKLAYIAMCKAIGLLEDLQELTQCDILFLAHTKVSRFNNPGSDPYDRYEPRLHEQVKNKFVDWCDEIFFVNYEVYTEQQDVGFNRTETKVTGGGQRMMYTSEKPAHIAKNRLNGLPEKIPFRYSVYRQYRDNEPSKDALQNEENS